MTTVSLEGHLALVTGGTGQLGRAMVRALGCAGADVAIQYHTSAERAEALAGEVREMGVRAGAFAADVRDEASVRALREAVGAGLGQPDILVLNAVTLYDWKPVLEQAAADYEGQFRGLVLQTVLMSQAFVPAMTERGWGRVIGISTECAMQCAATSSAYVFGKRGMDGVLRVLAHEVGPQGVTVNQVAPGWTISDRDREAGTEKHAPYDQRVPLRRRAEDVDIANAVVFFASDMARSITGAFLPVCGGMIMPAI